MAGIDDDEATRETPIPGPPGSDPYSAQTVVGSASPELLNAIRSSRGDASQVAVVPPPRKPSAKTPPLPRDDDEASLEMLVEKYDISVPPPRLPSLTDESLARDETEPLAVPRTPLPVMRQDQAAIDTAGLRPPPGAKPSTESGSAVGEPEWVTLTTQRQMLARVALGFALVGTFTVVAALIVSC